VPEDEERRRTGARARGMDRSVSYQQVASDWGCNVSFWKGTVGTTVARLVTCVWVRMLDWVHWCL